MVQYFFFLFHPCRERCFLSCGSGFLRVLDPQSRSQIRRRTRPQTTSSVSSFQTASQNLVSFLPGKQIVVTCANQLLHIVECLWRCCSLFVTVPVIHPSQMTSSLPPQLSGQSPSKTGSLVVPKRSCRCAEESPPPTESSCNSVLSLSVHLSACVAFNSLRLISSCASGQVYWRASLLKPLPLAVTSCRFQCIAMQWPLNSWWVDSDSLNMTP